VDLRQIMYFAYLYEDGTFTGAAKRAGVVQPALSMQIKRLEEELGGPLFTRSGRGAVPTALGRALYDIYSPIRRDLGAAKQRILELSSHTQPYGPLRCGLPPTFVRAILGRVVPTFVARYPKLDLEIKEGYGGTLMEWVLRGDLDFAIGAWSQEATGLDHQVIFDEDLVLATGQSLGLPRLAPCDLSVIQGINLIMPSPPHVLGQLVRRYIEQGLITPRRTMVVDSYLGVLEIARSSDWCALIPVTGLIEEVHNLGLWLHPIARPTLSFRWQLLHRSDRPLGLASRILLDETLTAIQAQLSVWRSMADTVSTRRGELI
jgi:LysR family nitrogen assimilation transcriptional regulator